MAQNNVNYNTMYNIGSCLKSTSAVFVKYRLPIVTYIMVDKLGHILQGCFRAEKKLQNRHKFIILINNVFFLLTEKNAKIPLP